MILIPCWFYDILVAFELFILLRLIFCHVHLLDQIFQWTIFVNILLNLVSGTSKGRLGISIHKTLTIFHHFSIKFITLHVCV